MRRLNPSPRRRSIAVAAALAGLIFSGAAWAQDGGPELFVDCRGVASAAHTVIMESGAFGTSAAWS